MGRIRRFSPWAIGGIAFVTVAALALYYANDWWLSGVVTASILVWLAGVLAAVYSRPGRRALVVGAVIAGFLYVLFALGPWFRGQVGPWLVTTQALVHVETKWLGRQQQPPGQVQQQIFTTYPVLMDTVYTGYNPGINTLQYVLSPTGPNGLLQTRFVEIGHWLCGWLAAAAGGLAAGWIARRSGRQTPQEGPQP